MTEIIKRTFRCEASGCNKEVTEEEFKKNFGVTVIEHGYGHEHHFCNSTCLGNWAKKYANK